MAQTNAQRTKRRPAPAKRTRSSGQGGRAGSANGASGGTRARSQGRSSGARSSGAATRSRSRSTAQSRSQAVRQTVRTRAQETGQAVERVAKSTGQTVGKAAGKAKGPAIAGGAALAGLAGGLALASSRVKSRRVFGVPVPRRSKLTKTGKALGHVAAQVGSTSQQLAVLNEEVRRTREQADRANRSPVEVLLSGLTNRKLGG